MSFQIEILTPSKALFKGLADEVALPSQSGEVDILTGHADYLATLKEGVVSVKTKEGPQSFNITGGFARILSGNLTVLVDQVI